MKLYRFLDLFTTDKLVSLIEQGIASALEAYQFQGCPSNSVELVKQMSFQQVRLLRESEHSQAMPATAHGLFVSNTRCSTSATTLNCAIHLSAAVTSPLPTPRPNPRETTASKTMKENARATFPHESGLVAPPGASMARLVVVEMQECAAGGRRTWHERVGDGRAGVTARRAES